MLVLAGQALGETRLRQRMADLWPIRTNVHCGCARSQLTQADETQERR